MRVLIIGGDAAGMSAASQIRRRQPDWQVTVLEKGLYTSYAACGIPYYLAGDIRSFDELVVVTPEDFREKRGIDVRMSWEALSIDVASRAVTARRADGEEERLDYDRLLIATGAEAILPAWDGLELRGVVSIRNLHDTRRFEDLLAEGARQCVIIGAGYIGLEMAEALARRGLRVAVVEKLSGVMGGADPELTEMVTEELKSRSIEVRLETSVVGFAGSNGRLHAVETDRGRLSADLALISLGVRPNVALARDAGIALGETGAIRVADSQRTSVPDVFSAGDCAEAFHLVLRKPAWVPLALTANRQGRVAGAVMAGTEDRFPGIVGSAVTRVFDLVLARTGIDERTADMEGIPHASVTATAPSKAHYFPGRQSLWVKLLYRSDDYRLLGATLAGKDESAGKRCDIVATAISAGMTVEQLAGLDLTYAPPFAPVWDPILQAANKARFRLEEQSR